MYHAIYSMCYDILTKIIGIKVYIKSSYYLSWINMSRRINIVQYGNIGCGVQSSGILNYVDFCLKVTGNIEFWELV